MYDRNKRMNPDIKKPAIAQKRAYPKYTNATQKPSLMMLERIPNTA